MYFVQDESIEKYLLLMPYIQYSSFLNVVIKALLPSMTFEFVHTNYSIISFMLQNKTVSTNLHNIQKQIGLISKEAICSYSCQHRVNYNQYFQIEGNWFRRNYEHFRFRTPLTMKKCFGEYRYNSTYDSNETTIRLTRLKVRHSFSI